ncbi:MAG TPA: phosphoenolpyruvate synthase [Candidatus Saccharimonadales bacterium]|nr:phosphoenolpyruvate synthase [Candidatus Saccharimonadales bacterium]
MPQNVVWFKDVDKNDIDLVGGKGANLGELTKIGAPVPNGFIVTSQAYFDSVKNSGALDRIKGILYGLNTNDPVDLQRKAQACQKEIKNIELPKSLENEIESHYKKLGNGKQILVAVRSSATAEDLPNASFAGQQKTFLNVKGKEELKRAILDAWASLFEARAIFYRQDQKFDHFKVGIAIPVQIMVQSQTSGVMFTVDPITGNKNTAVIEAIWGLGELIVGGQATPDHFEVEKQNFTISVKSIAKQEKQLVKVEKGNKLVTIAKAHQKSQKLPDAKVLELAKIGKMLENHYFSPQDIEWAYTNGKIYLVQTRPITTLGKKKKEEETKMPENQIKNVILEGAPASPAIATGKVVIIHSPKELNKIKQGDVLVTEVTNPDFVPAMRRAVAIVTDKGGRTSHAAIVSRELGIACVVGTQDATKKLKDGQIVTVDGAKGLIYKGSIQTPGKNLNAQLTASKQATNHNTATKLYVNLAEVEKAVEIAAKNVDGVGLLRAEFMLAAIGTHPKKFIKDKKEDEFVNILSSKLSTFGKAFGKRPVIYRASDLKSSEYRHLKGGEAFEPNETNPMLGYRGAFRYLKDPDTFKLELRALKLARQNHKNLRLMIPFVRNPQELIAVKSMVEEQGLFQDKSFELLMMAELPTNVFRLQDFIDVGIDGISIGSNDLTMLILGTDRDNEEVASEFNEMDPAVLSAYEKIIKTCVQNKLDCSICGQAPSFFPELTEKLVKWGITSISVNPDKIDQTRQIIYEAEKKLVL